MGIQMWDLNLISFIFFVIIIFKNALDIVFSLVKIEMMILIAVRMNKTLLKWYFRLGLSNSTAGTVFAFHMANLGLISSTSYGPPNPARNNSQVQSQEFTLSIATCGPQTNSLAQINSWYFKDQRDRVELKVHACL